MIEFIYMFIPNIIAKRICEYKGHIRNYWFDGGIDLGCEICPRCNLWLNHPGKEVV